MFIVRRRKNYVSILGIVLALVVILSPSARAGMYSFAPLTNNTGQPGVVVPQLSVDVTEGTGADTGLVLFTFLNDVGVPSSITHVYFDDGTLDEDGDGIDFISSSAGVSFSIDGTAGVLPGGNNADPDFATSFSAGANSAGGLLSNGVNSSSEWLTVKFAADYDDVIAAINLGFTDPYGPGWYDESLRIGIHVQGIPYASGTGSTSESYIMTPIPGAVLLGILGLSVVGIKLRKYA
jgi:hypothetical protein